MRSDSRASSAASIVFRTPLLVLAFVAIATSGILMFSAAEGGITSVSAAYAAPAPVSASSTSGSAESGSASGSAPSSGPAPTSGPASASGSAPASGPASASGSAPASGSAAPASDAASGQPDEDPEPIETTIAGLTSTDTSLDGLEVTFVGEAVGGVYNSERSGYKWVNVEADGSVIGVYMTEEDAESIPTFGSSGVKGSTLRITGIYHIACDDGHAGELDVHADTVAITDEGGEREPDTAPLRRWIIAGVLLAAGIGLLVVNQHLSRKGR